MKLQNLLSGPQGDISSVLLQKTVSELQPNLKNLHSMVRLEDALSAGKSAKLVQEDFYVFHTTLVQLQKILEAAENKATPDIRPLLKRTLTHNMSLIGLLFHYIVIQFKQLKEGQFPNFMRRQEKKSSFWVISGKSFFCAKRSL